MTLPAILLAAGGSSRMGARGPKQLLEVGGESMVRRAVRAALGAGCTPVIAVVGHEGSRVSEAVAGLGVLVERNIAWHAGMGGSLKRGLARALVEVPGAEGVLVLLADQPFISVEHLGSLLRRFDGRRAVASTYHGAAAVPAVLPAAMFEAVMNLGDEAGAKVLLQGAEGVPLSEPDDVDTPDDYERLASRT